MFQKARDASVPIDTIERAIKRGTGELEGVDYESITYEGYAPHGVALYVETLSDNRNRTGSEVRSLLGKNGGSLAEPGSVAWQFERKGIILIPEGIDEDEIMMVALEAGAEDLVDEGGIWRLTCDPSVLSEVRSALETADLDFNSADVTMLPTTTVTIDNESDARSVLKVIDLLDDLDDVQDVYANFDIPEEIFDLIQD